MFTFKSMVFAKPNNNCVHVLWSSQPLSVLCPPPHLVSTRNKQVTRFLHYIFNFLNDHFDPTQYHLLNTSSPAVMPVWEEVSVLGDSTVLAVLTQNTRSQSPDQYFVSIWLSRTQREFKLCLIGPTSMLFFYLYLWSFSNWHKQITTL